MIINSCKFLVNRLNYYSGIAIVLSHVVKKMSYEKTSYLLLANKILSIFSHSLLDKREAAMGGVSRCY